MVLKLIASLKRAGKTVICFSEDSEIIKLSDKQTNLGWKDDREMGKMEFI